MSTTKTPSRPDDSVQFALAELEAIEGARREEEARQARAREEAAAAERVRAENEREAIRRKERARAEREAAVAREVARLDVDARVAERTAEGAEKLAAMRVELERIRAERALIQDRMLAGSLETPPPPARHWPMVAGLFAALASILGVLLFVQATTPPPAPEVIVREVHVPVAAPTPDPAAPEVEAVAPEVEPTPEPARPRTRPRPRPQPAEAPLGDLDQCGDDPLCGVD